MKIPQVQTTKTFRQNGMKILPRMLEDFLARSGDVVGHPQRVEELHKLRIRGKQLRYTMELYKTTFGKRFRRKLSDVEKVIELMGAIHDADSFTAELEKSLREAKNFNRRVADPAELYSLVPLRRMCKDQLARRESAFNELSVILKGWRKNGFKRDILSAMNVKQSS